ncbi:MAG: hypothetical protein GY722_04950, partial [bacterium]|nr:hypothetical protein [bacterium]
GERDVVASYDYLPYGEEAESRYNPLQFTGHERDSHLAGGADDLDYMHARYYSPYLSRFSSVDPVLGDPAMPQSWNRYGYALSSPINYIDPTGNAFFAALGVAWAVVEIAGSIADVVEVAQVWSDSNTSLGNKLGTTGLAAVGLVAPGGGYSKIDDAVRVTGDVVDGARAVGRMADDAGGTFEILDGVRRSKAAEFVGNDTIPAQVIDAQQRDLGVFDLPIDSLRSPKPTIDISTHGATDRFFRKNLEPARAGSTPPPILVTPGTRGTPIRDVTLDPYGN